MVVVGVAVWPFPDSRKELTRVHIRIFQYWYNQPMTDVSHKDEYPISVLENLRKKIQDGSQLLLDELTDEELVAMHELLLEGKAEIISLACRPYLSAKQDRIMISQ